MSTPARRCKGCSFALVVLFFGACLVVVALFLPEDPSIPDFFVDDASVSSNGLTTTFSLHVSGYNPNVLFSFHYDDVLVSLYHNTTLLANTVLPGTCDHPPRARLTLGVDLVAPNGQLDTVEGLRAPRSSAGTANLEVRMKAETQYEIAGWDKSHSMLKAACSPVRVKFSSSPDAAREAHCGCFVDLIS